MAPTIVVAPGQFEDAGTDGPDVIVADSPGVIRAGAGDDRVCATGNVGVIGGGGDDRIRSGGRRLNGGSGHDLLTSTRVLKHLQDGGAGLQGGPGDDILRDGGTMATLVGGRGNDQYIGNGDRCTRHARLCTVVVFRFSVAVDLRAGTSTGGREGTDTIRDVLGVVTSTRGTDEIRGSANAEYLDAGLEGYVFRRTPENIVVGRGGNDILKAGRFSDRLFGGDGNDLLYGYQGSDTLRGGSGDDQLHGGSGPRWTDTCIDSFGANAFVACEIIR